MVLPMIEFKVGDILNADVEAIVNTVNCVGIMGKGIALQFKMKYPENYNYYKKTFNQGRMMIGKMLVFETNLNHNPKFIINFPTKRHWKGKSSLQDIKKGLDSLIVEIKRLKIKSIAIPALGSGLGGLNWNEVKSIISDALNTLPEVIIWVYEPSYVPEAKSIVVNTKKPKLTLAKALLIKLLQVYQVLGYPHSLLEIQKLMYFINQVENELKFSFVKSKYGPYDKNINFLLQARENHYTRGFGDGVQRAEITLLDNAIAEANNYLNNQSKYVQNVKRIETLVDGFETPFGMELLSTVHWVAVNECNNPKYDSEEVISTVHQWSERKQKLFKPEHIRVALNHLIANDWL